MSVSPATYSDLANGGVVDVIKGEILIPFDPSNPSYAVLLERLWAGVHADDAYPGHVGPHWKRFGFQGDDPASDIRGARYLGLQYLVRLVESGVEPVLTALHKSHLEFPFSACTLNVFRLLVCHLSLETPQPRFCPCCKAAVSEIVLQATHIRVLRTFANLQSADPDALFQLYRLCVELMCQLWTRRHAAGLTLLQFNEVLAELRVGLLATLAEEPPDFASLHETLRTHLRLP